ncbi:hypothetical protein H8D36_05525 [archaeon]|nr:hypothetical protein [archaeon]MBL7057288.1 hypothetical protein [Candidatus Woesearchaeota archaeon]
MAHLDIAPPPPPKFLNDKEEKNPDTSMGDKKKKVVNGSEKKKGLFGDIFGKKKIDISEVKELSDHEELNLEKLRQDFGIPTREEKPHLQKLKNKGLPPAPEIKEPVKSANWDEGDILEEMHKPKEEGPRWDVEEPDHIKAPKKISVKKTSKKIIKKPIKKITKVAAIKKSVKKVSAKSVVKKPLKKVTPKKLIVKKKKIVVKKTVIKKPKLKKPKKGNVDKVIDEYFKSVEREQKLIQKELEQIVVHPKKALKKTSNDYIIHHNEKLIKSMKELLAAIKTIDNEKFDKNVQSNKKAFSAWVKKILDSEKSAELQRNKILKQKMKEILKEYGLGINRDIVDKKYELDSQKKALEHKEKHVESYAKKVERFDVRIKTKEKKLQQKEKELNAIVEEKVKAIIDKRLKKEQLSLAKSEKQSAKLISEYTASAEKLKTDWSEFNKHKEEALQLLDEADVLKKTKVYLERKDAKLNKNIEELTAKDKLLKTTTKELEEKEATLEAKDKKLTAEVKKLEAKDDELLQKEKELTLELRDFETRRKEFELREKEVKEMENHLSSERGDLQEIKENLMFRETETKHKLTEVKEIEKHIEDEEKELLDNRKMGDINFQKYLHSKFQELSDKPENKVDENLKEFYQLIDICQDMVKNNQLFDAKNVYSKIKDKFHGSNISSDDREILYNSIRELYDDINLSLISQ